MPLALSACAKPRKDPDRPKKDDPLPVASVELGAGHTTVDASNDPKAPPSFTLRWSKGQIDADKGTVETGRLTEPQGEIYQGAKPTSTYRADQGVANRRDNRLNLEGGVRLRSIDKAQTLKAPHAEYRGDSGLLRATGGVVATGTFGTLSGVPELWATRDLKTLGTPDMIAQKLKIPALVALAATAAVGAPRVQKGQTYDFANNGSILAENLPTGLRLTLKPVAGKPLVFRLPDRGMVVESTGTVVAEFAPGKSRDVRHLTAAGKVHVVQTTKDGTTTLDGQDAVYDWKGGETADLDLAGPVTILRNAKVKDRAGALVEQTTTAKGAKGSATLVAKPKGDEDGLKQAVLSGAVTLDLSEVDGEAFKGSGERLVYTPGKDTNGATLTGGTTMVRTSKGPDGSSVLTAKGARGTAVLHANPPQGANPVKTAVLDGDVALDVSGSNGETFKGSGDRVVYTAEGENGRAVMTGALKFAGDAAEFAGNLTDVDTATMLIGKDGWKSVETTNSGKPITTTIKTKPKKKGGKP